MTDKYLLVLDEGTTSTRAMLYAPDGTLGASAQQALEQFYPRPGWVEHDPHEILDKTLACAREVIAKAGGPERIAGIGVTNQRETVVAWDKTTGRALGADSPRAIVWQDRRTATFCDALRDAGHEPALQAKTGLLLDPYFSGSKMRWMLDHVPGARELGDNLAFGTIETWLVWHMTGGLHVSDVSNASRTCLFALDGKDWDPDLLDLFGVPRAALGKIVASAGAIGETRADVFGAPIPITGLAGDQQAATIGQGCLSPGETKATFGTGAFILTNMGGTLPRSTNRLLGTVLCEVAGVRQYALEGSVFAAGSLIKWLRDNLGMVITAGESETLARAVPDSGGVTFIPALSGLGAPHWRPNATGSIAGLTFSVTRAHVVRAALESMAHQCHDLKQAFDADGADWQLLRIDGGMSGNDWLAQDLADMLEVTVERPVDVETTARGAAMLAAVGARLYPSLEAAKAMLPEVECFDAALDGHLREARLAAWHGALKAALA
ncbi:glycerol kinase [Novosphingobium sp.]|uniref:FGGY family carbohydrate kinase n=1 Tax=Novosphingobium sp. TaxID=1874826 RepID=UPI002600EC18|nr:glycerol kinase [Novosphingobium sp.]